MRTAVVLLAVLPAAGAQADLFDGRLQPVAPEPVSIVAADVDGDGLTDLVTANDAGNSISVLLAEGAGRFAPAQDQAAAAEPNGILAADLDGDGDVDLVLCHSRLDRVAVGLNDGHGVFVPWMQVPVGDDPRTIAMGDLDADGNLDVVTANFGSATASVLLGDGAGGFAPATTHPAQPGAFGVAVGDLDHDGFDDVVTADSGFPSTVTIMLGDGAGGFSSVTHLQPDVAPHAGAQSVTIADLNADGDADLVVGINVGFGPGFTTLLLGDGAGGFGTPLPVGIDLGCHRAVLDLDGDGRLDVAGTTGSPTGGFNGGADPELRVALGDGTGGFAPQTRWATGLGPLAMAAGDLDQDGRPDLAVAARDAQAVVLHFGDGSGGFRSPAAQVQEESPNAGIVVADLDGGGAADVVATSSDGYAVFLGDGRGSLGPPAFTTHPSCFATVALAAGELNGDGVPDLAVSFVTGCKLLRAEFGDGLGGFPTHANLGGKTSDVAIADMNGDTFNDVIDGEGDFLVVRLGTGGGGFMPAQMFPTCTVGGLEVADFTGDGWLDAVTICLVSQLVTLLPGDGSGSFTGAMVLDADATLEWMTSGDVDGNGLPDIVLAEDDTLTVLLNLGGGSFEAARHFSLQAYSPTSTVPPKLAGVVLADVDGDLHLDAIAANGQASTVSVLLGDGAGDFEFAGAFLATGNLRGLATGDLDADGFPDVVVGSSSTSGGKLGVLLNRTTGPWTDLGAALAGSLGLPGLSAQGSLKPSSPISIAISNGPAFGTATLIIGGSALDVPFKGGTLVPFPNLLLFGLPLNASGGFAASGTWFGQLPSGTATWFQAWMHDPGGPAGWSATNALLGVVP
jgi:hypothetical protein